MKEIRLAIVGSRGFNDYERLCNVVSDLAEREQVCVVGIVSGGALGVDSLGAHYAQERGLQLTEFLPEYEKYGRGGTSDQKQDYHRECGLCSGCMG